MKGPLTKGGMVDVSGKKVTKRVAIASGRICLSKPAYEALIKKGSPKGDVFDTAKVAGIQAAKETSRIIPFCHPLPLNKVSVSFEPNARTKSILIRSEVICLGQTGVEMEALTAVSAAALTIYDMMKWADQTMVISEIKLEEKTGGKSDFHRSSKKVS